MAKFLPRVHLKYDLACPKNFYITISYPELSFVKVNFNFVSTMVFNKRKFDFFYPKMSLIKEK